MEKVAERHPRTCLAPSSSTRRCANAWHGTISTPRRRLRGSFWDADDEMVEPLKGIYVDWEDPLEGIMMA
jgi:hypothetical protein